MLVMARRSGEADYIHTNDGIIKIYLNVRGHSQARIGFDAPKKIKTQGLLLAVMRCN